MEAASKALFGQGELGDLDGATLAGALAEVPRASVPAGELPALIDLMAMTGIVDSKSAARRAIREGGAYLNNVKITDEAFVPSVADLVGTRFLVLRRGKREIGAIEVE